MKAEVEVYSLVTPAENRENMATPAWRHVRKAPREVFEQRFPSSYRDKAICQPNSPFGAMKTSTPNEKNGRV